MKKIYSQSDKRKISLGILMYAFLSFFFGSVAHAQTSEGGSKEPRRQSINFEDELIEGNVQKPDLFYIFQKKNFNYKRLIKLRENFLPEMRKTSEDIQRVRGGN